MEQILRKLYQYTKIPDALVHKHMLIKLYIKTKKRKTNCCFACLDMDAIKSFIADKDKDLRNSLMQQHLKEADFRYFQIREDAGGNFKHYLTSQPSMNIELKEMLLTSSINNINM
jgi:hypothetical protein